MHKKNTLNDQNLLFGVISRQLGIVSRDQFVTAVNRGSQTEGDLAEFFVQSNWISTDERQVIDSLVRLHLKRHENDFEKSLAFFRSIEDFRSTHEFEEHPSESTWAHEFEETAYEAGLSEQALQRFRILRPLAKGGLGQVSVALDSELQREVALKEMHFRFADIPDNRDRFLREAEITGALEHPGIVPVYGCGKYSDGRPFFAMRLIRGKSLKAEILEFHRQRKNDWHSSEAALELRKLMNRFVDVCDAVHYAHSRGVLHRDIKPSNIMLGDFGETLLVDWGLSKPLDAIDEEIDSVWERVSSPNSVVSKNGSTVGTPAYMSPEQANGNASIDIRSDVFSLGATLYCILTGKPPHSDETPDKTLDRAKQGHVRQAREINRFAPRVLEAIAMKAMSPDQQERYDSPRTLADDIENWISDQPTTAYDESITETATRWAKRHRAWAFSGIAALVLVTIISAVSFFVVHHQKSVIASKEQKALDLSAQNRILANQERDAKITAQQKHHVAEQALQRHQEVLDFLVEAFHRPDARQAGAQLRVIEVMDQALGLLNSGVEISPLTKATTLDAISRTLLSLSIAERAMEPATQALEIRTAELGENHPETIKSRSVLGRCFLALDQPERAQELFASNLNFVEQKFGRESYEAIITQGDLALVHYALGDPQFAVELGEKTTNMATQVLGASHAATLRFVHELTMYYRALGETSEPTDLMETVRRCEQSLGETHPTTLAAKKALARTLVEFGEFEKAIPLFQEAFEAETSKLGTRHPLTLTTALQLGEAYRSAGQASHALAIFQRVMNKTESTFGGNAFRWDAMVFLGKAYSDLGQDKKALALFQRALALGTNRIAESDPAMISLMDNIATSLRRLHRFDEALAVSKKALANAKREVGDDNRLTRIVQNNLGLIFIGLKRYQEAIPILEQAVQSAQMQKQTDTVTYSKILKNLADAYAKSGSHEKAIELHEQALAKKQDLIGDEHPSTFKSVAALLRSYREQNDFVKAHQFIEEWIPKLPQEDPNSISLINQAAILYMSQNDWEKALPLNQKALQISRRAHGDQHAITLSCLGNLSANYYELRKFDDAESLQRQLIANLPKANRLPKIQFLVEILFAKSAFTAAKKEAESLQQIAQQADDLNATIDAQILLGEISIAQNSEGEAKRYFMEIDKEIQRIEFPLITTMTDANQKCFQSYFAIKNGEWEAAQKMLLACYQVYEIDERGRQRLRQRISIHRMMDLYNKWKKPDEFEKWKMKMAELP